MTTIETPSRGWSYAVIWRWHFYAGLLCAPFVLWLSLTGPIYLFKPQIDAWLDRPYDNLQIEGERAAPSVLVKAALAAEPGSALNAFEMPKGEHSAARVLVGRGETVWRVYVHPTTRQILKIVNDEKRFTRLLFYLHGELLLGTAGSMAVELAASWGVVMILSGLYLWWPREASGFGGVVYPRALSGRAFWKDLHAVVGFWVSAFALFLLITGLPWAASWGGMLKDVRGWNAGAPIRQDWTTGQASALADASLANDQHAAHRRSAADGGASYDALDRLVPVVAKLDMAYPTLIAPPSARAPRWTARSDAQDRPLREKATLDPSSGAVLSRVRFSDWPLIDRLVGYGVAIHEGQFFGWLNTALGVLTGAGVWTLAVSGLVMWWKRRPGGRLGAPAGAGVSLPAPLWCLLAIMGVLLPLMGASLLIVLALDRWAFPRMGPVQRFLGLSPG